MRHRRSGGRRLILAGGAIGALAASTLAGCGAATIAGKVMRGDIGRVVIVDGSDKRLLEPGLAGIQVQMSTPVLGRGGKAVLGESVTDETGSFRLKVDGGAKLPTRVSIRASGSGEYEVNNSIFRPRPGEQVLVLMRPPKSP